MNSTKNGRTFLRILLLFLVIITAAEGLTTIYGRATSNYYQPRTHCTYRDDIPKARPNNTMVTNSRYPHGTTISYICNRGYRLLGNRERRCKSGVWTPVKFRCVLSKATTTTTKMPTTTAATRTTKKKTQSVIRHPTGAPPGRRQRTYASCLLPDVDVAMYRDGGYTPQHPLNSVDHSQTVVQHCYQDSNDSQSGDTAVLHTSVCDDGKWMPPFPNCTATDMSSMPNNDSDATNGHAKTLETKGYIHMQQPEPMNKTANGTIDGNSQDSHGSEIRNGTINGYTQDVPDPEMRDGAVDDQVFSNITVATEVDSRNFEHVTHKSLDVTNRTSNKVVESNGANNSTSSHMYISVLANHTDIESEPVDISDNSSSETDPHSAFTEATASESTDGLVYSTSPPAGTVDEAPSGTKLTHMSLDVTNRTANKVVESNGTNISTSSHMYNPVLANQTNIETEPVDRSDNSRSETDPHSAGTEATTSESTDGLVNSTIPPAGTVDEAASGAKQILKERMCKFPSVNIARSPDTDEYSADEEVKIYHCRQNLVRVGSTRMRCQNDGTWHGDVDCLPYCENGVDVIHETSYNYIDDSAIEHEVVPTRLDSTDECLQLCVTHDEFVCRAIRVNINRRNKTVCMLLASAANSTHAEGFLVESADSGTKYRIYNRNCDDKCQVPDLEGVIFRNQDGVPMITGQNIFPGTTLGVTCKYLSMKPNVTSVTCMSGIWNADDVACFA